jgi:hypothetical protein
VARGQLDQLDAAAGEISAAADEEGIRSIAFEGREGRVYLTAGVGVEH